jgi:hypothetical protein
MENMIQNLDIHELSTLITLASARLNNLLMEVVQSGRSLGVSKRLNSALEDPEGDPEYDYDRDDYDPSVETPSKSQLDLELLLHRFKDPRLSEEDKKEIKKEIVELLVEI